VLLLLPLTRWRTQTVLLPQQRQMVLLLLLLRSPLHP
jgi:hypothetical protein